MTNLSWKALLLAGLAAPVFAGGTFLPPGSQRVKGDGYSFYITAPMGWVLDLEAGKLLDSDAVLYPKGTRYDDAPSVLYASAAQRDKGKNLAELIQLDFNGTKSQNPRLAMEKGPTLYSLLQKPAQVRFYNGFKDGHWEADAYLEEEDVIVTFVLSSSDEKIFHEDLPALQVLVASYVFAPEEDQGPALGVEPQNRFFSWKK